MRSFRNEQPTVDNIAREEFMAGQLLTTRIVCRRRQSPTTITRTSNCRSCLLLRRNKALVNFVFAALVYSH